jgi:sec-independent protein translocase protein TatA
VASPVNADTEIQNGNPERKSKIQNGSPKSRTEHFMFEGLFQPMHLLVIFGLALLVLGPKRLPELGKGIGEGIRGFKTAVSPTEKAPETKKEIV